MLALLAAAIQAPAARAPDCLIEPEPSRDSAALSGIGRMLDAEYGAADSAFSAGLPAGSPAQAYFRGLNLFYRFNDLGDTASLFRAESLWTAAADRGSRNAGSRNPADSGNLALYRGLSTLQLSYVASLTRRGTLSARLGLRAAGQLKPCRGTAEADAALALFDYYKATLLKGVDWLPFVKADAEGPLRRLEASVPRSRYLRDILQPSLLWLYYDTGRYDQGLALIDTFLVRHPGNRIYRQMRADFLFRRSGPGTPGVPADLAAALAIHESLLREYEGFLAASPPPACLPLGYLSSVGNLAKIHGKLGNSEALRKYLGIWSSPRFSAYSGWLPASLRKEVDALRE